MLNYATDTSQLYGIYLSPCKTQSICFLGSSLWLIISIFHFETFISLSKLGIYEYIERIIFLSSIVSFVMTVRSCFEVYNFSFI